jgi:hypothetical protein
MHAVTACAGPSEILFVGDALGLLRLQTKTLKMPSK